MSEADLRCAARDSDVAKVQRCLAAGVSVSCKDGDGWTPLHWAAHNGHKEVAALLLGAGAAVDAATKNGATPLHYAAGWEGHKEVAALLLGAGAAVDAATDNGNTPLHNAAFNGHKEVAALLLGAGAAVDAANEDGWTPLQWAAYKGHKEVAALLLGAGAAVDTAAEERKTPLYLAAKHGRKEVAVLLLDAGAAVDAADKDGKTPADVCCTGYNAEQGNKGPILAALTAAAAARKAAPKQQQAVAVAPAPPAVKLPPRQPLAVPAVGAALSLYGGGTVTLAASAFKASVLGSELLKAGLQAAVQVAGAVVTASPLGLIQAVTLLAQGLQCSQDAVLWCKERAARAGDRAAALVPALQELEKAVLAPGQDVEVQLVESISVMLVLLAKALLELKQLLLQFQKSSEVGVMKRMLHFLSAQGFRQQFEEQEQELRDCLVQLSTILSMAQFTSQARVAAMVREQREQANNWRQQNEADQRVDMQQLEGLMLQAVRGVEGLKTQLATQEGMLQGQAVGLEQVQRWLAEMHASSAVITGHLQRLHAKVDDIAVKLDTIVHLMTFDRNAGIAELTELAPTQLIPRASITIPEGALARGASGSFGTVVRAVRDGGAVAVKLYNITQVGKLDQRDAIREALLLSQVSHHNVVTCWGMVHDPHSAQGDSLHGSLVMDWVGGGNVYDFLQDAPGTELRVRLHIALQVAAGMRHLHKHKMVHGDLKPQNILLQLNQGETLPTVKICDFGLAKYSSSSMPSQAPAASSARTVAKLGSSSLPSQAPATSSARTLEYSSPERLLRGRRSRYDDVYAFGIVMYFIASSRTPYSDIDSADVERVVKNGARPEIEEWEEAEEYSPELMQGVVAPYCELARQCWSEKPAERPAFDAIYARLAALAASM